MTVRQALTVAAALTALLFGAACGDHDNATLPPETDEPLFVQGKQLEKQGRNPEALTAFLKLIDRRGERGAPESHLEAGLINLQHTKDPLAACYHFRRYLELAPNSREAPLVRGKVEDARREFARSLSARPLEDQSSRLEFAEEVAKLRRERDELRAELAALRGATPVQMRPSLITMPDVAKSQPVAPPVTPIGDSPIAPAPLPRAGALVAAPAPRVIQPAQTRAQPTTAAAAQPTRPATKSSARTHTVAAGDTFFNLSKRFGVKMEDLAAANGMTIKSPLKVGTVLKIP